FGEADPAITRRHPGAVRSLRPAGGELLRLLVALDRVDLGQDGFDHLLERALRRALAAAEAILRLDLAADRLALRFGHALAGEAGALAVFLRVRALQEEAEQRIRIDAARVDLAAAGEFALHPLDRARPGGELDRRRAHRQRDPAIFGEAPVAFLMAVDGLRGDA